MGDEPKALSEQTATDQARFGTEDEVPGLADVANAKASGAGLAEDIRDGAVQHVEAKDNTWADRGQEYHAGPEQPSVPFEDDQVVEDSGT